MSTDPRATFKLCSGHPYFQMKQIPPEWKSEAKSENEYCLIIYILLKSSSSITYSMTYWLIDSPFVQSFWNIIIGIKP